MPERTLKPRQAVEANDLLQNLSPDGLSDEMMSAVLWNRKALEGYTEEWWNNKISSRIREYIVTDDDGQIKEPDENDTPLEQNLEVKLSDVQAADEALADLLQEEVTVTVATVSIGEIQGIDLREHLDLDGEAEGVEAFDLLDRFHFMLDVEV